MNVVDLLIVILILSGGIMGFNRGFTKELVSFVGFLLTVVLAFLLKNQVAILFYENLPFFKFGGFIKGVTVLNILVYEILAFLVVLFILTILLRIALLATTVFEKILNATYVLAIPSKLLGLVVGLVHYFVIAFIVIYVLSLPVFGFKALDKSEYREPILNKTPILSDFTKDTTKVVNEFAALKEKYQSDVDSMQFNYETLELFLKYKIVDVKSVERLREKDKLVIDNLDYLLEQYKKGE